MRWPPQDGRGPHAARLEHDAAGSVEDMQALVHRKQRESLSEIERESALELTPEQRAELDRRWAEHQQNPASAGVSPLPKAGVSFGYFSEGCSGVIRLGSASAAVGSIPLRLPLCASGRMGPNVEQTPRGPRL
jgi:hypothetical protein